MVIQDQALCTACRRLKRGVWQSEVGQGELRTAGFHPPGPGNMEEGHAANLPERQRLP